jgi:hypothetical protein
MKDWFYANDNEIVSSSTNTDKSTLVLTIKKGYKTLAEIERKLGVIFSASEHDDINYFIRIYSPLSYDNQSGCQGCDGCAADKCGNKGK